MEYLDVCTEDGRPTGQTVSRDAAHREGILHRTAHVWIAREKRDGYDIKDNEVTWVYVYSAPVEADDLTLQASEVDEARWFDLEEVWTEIQTCRDRFCMASAGLNILREYLKRSRKL